jgi:hypothetical protein
MINPHALIGEWLIKAAQAERNGDEAYRDRCLSEAARLAALVQWESTRHEK